eukprot:358726-Chlamydomonas_euryale.AAC.7
MGMVSQWALQLKTSLCEEASDARAAGLGSMSGCTPCIRVCGHAPTRARMQGVRPSHTCADARLASAGVDTHLAHVLQGAWAAGTEHRRQFLSTWPLWRAGLRQTGTWVIASCALAAWQWPCPACNLSAPAAMPGTCGLADKQTCFEPAEDDEQQGVTPCAWRGGMHKSLPVQAARARHSMPTATCQQRHASNVPAATCQQRTSSNMPAAFQQRAGNNSAATCQQVVNDTTCLRQYADHNIQPTTHQQQRPRYAPPPLPAARANNNAPRTSHATRQGLQACEPPLSNMPTSTCLVHPLLQVLVRLFDLLRHHAEHERKREHREVVDRVDKDDRSGAGLAEQVARHAVEEHAELHERHRQRRASEAVVEHAGEQHKWHRRRDHEYKLHGRAWACQ